MRGKILLLKNKLAMRNENQKNILKMPAGNKRFGASGGVTSNNLLWGI